MADSESTMESTVQKRVRKSNSTSSDAGPADGKSRRSILQMISSSTQVTPHPLQDLKREMVHSSTQMTPHPNDSLLPSRPHHPRDSLLLSAPDAHYRYFMNHGCRGMAVIINNESFDATLGMAQRTGTQIDAANLEDAFRLLGFETPNIHRYDDLTVKNMRKAMDYYAAEINYEAMDCFICAILSHGNEGVIYGRDGKTNVDELLLPFKKYIHPTLLGKPKIFLIQACRGDRFENGVQLPYSVESDDSSAQRLPAEADFLYAYSTVPGYFSWRNGTRGSWFIEAFTRKLRDMKNPGGPATDQAIEVDFQRLLTRVSYDVAYNFESRANTAGMSAKKQVPSVVSMLTKDLYF